MPFDGIVVSAVVKELIDKLLYGRIEKIYQPETDEINLVIRNNGSSHKLLITANSSYPRVHLTNNNKQNPQSPPMFCMLLRKHLNGGKIISIAQKNFDRIVLIDIESYDELGDFSVKRIIIEIMGRHSNIILLDSQSNKIIDSIKRISGDINRHREVLPGRTYIEPPEGNKANPLNISPCDFVKIIKNNFNDIALFKGIYSSLQGISPVVAKEVCYRTNICPDTISTHLNDNDLMKIWESLSFIIRSVVFDNPKPIIIQEMNTSTVIDFYAMDLLSLLPLGNILTLDSMSDVIEKYYFRKDLTERIKQKSTDLKKCAMSAIDKIHNKKQKLLQEYQDANNSDMLRILGDLITANLYKITAGMKEIKVENYYDDNKEIIIPLEIRLSPSQNAQKFFKKYSKSKIALIEIKKQLFDVDSEIEYFENILQSIENSTSSDDIEEIRMELIEEGYLSKRKTPLKKNKKPLKKLLTFVSSDGYEIHVGKNNRQNDLLTLKIASKNDFWFHTKNMPGSHVVLMTNNSVPPEKSLLEAAKLAAFFSKGKMSDNVAVDYTLIKNVKKAGSSKPGMVIYDSYKTIYITPHQDEIEKMKQK